MVVDARGLGAVAVAQVDQHDVEALRHEEVRDLRVAPVGLVVRGVEHDRREAPLDEGAVARRPVDVEREPDAVAHRHHHVLRHDDPPVRGFGLAPGLNAGHQTLLSMIEIPDVVHPQREPGMHDRGRVELLDDRRPGERHARPERVAVEDRAVHVPARLGEVDRPALLRLRCLPGVEAARWRLRDPPDARQPQAHDLDRLGGRAEAVRAVVLGVEALPQVVAGRDRELEALADVAQVDLPQELDRLLAEALPLELLSTRVLEPRERRRRPRRGRGRRAAA